MEVRSLNKQPSRRSIMREKSMRLERHGSTRSDGSTGIANCSLSDSSGSFAGRLNQQPSRRSILREKSIRLERRGSMRSDGSSFRGIANLSMSDSFGSFASRDSMCPHKKEEKVTAASSEGPINAISSYMQHRLEALDKMKNPYCSSHGLDLDVIAAGEEDEESQTRVDDSFGTLESEFDSEYDDGNEDDAEGGA